MHDGAPATAEVAEIIEFAKRRGVMLSSDGPANNVFKIKPPLVVQKTDVDTFLEVFQDGLAAVAR
jgi:4-aminobutyrate aminotransferase-like enzyme